MAKHILNNLSLEEKEQMERDQVQEDLNSVVPDEPTTNNIVEATVAEKEAENLVTETFENIEIGFEELDNLHLAKKNLEKVNNDNAYPTQQVAAVVMANEAMKYCCKSIGLDHSRYNVSVESLESTANVQLTLEGVGELANKAWEGIKKAAKAVWDFIVKWWNKFLQLIGLKAKDTEAKAEEVKETAEKVENEVAQSDLPEAEKAEIGNAVSQLKESTPGSGKKFFSTLGSTIKNKVLNFADKASDFGGKVIDSLTNGSEKAANYFSGFTQSKAELLKKAGIETGTLKELIEKNTVVFGNESEGYYSKLMDLAYVIKPGTAKDMSSLVSSLSGTVKELNNRQTKTFNSIEAPIKKLIETHKANPDLQPGEISKDLSPFIHGYYDGLKLLLPAHAVKDDISKFLNGNDADAQLNIKYISHMDLDGAKLMSVNLLSGRTEVVQEIETNGHNIGGNFTELVNLSFDCDAGGFKKVTGLIGDLNALTKNLEAMTSKTETYIKSVEAASGDKNSMSTIAVKIYTEISKTYALLFNKYGKGIQGAVTLFDCYLAHAKAGLDAVSLAARHSAGKEAANAKEKAKDEANLNRNSVSSQGNQEPATATADA